MKRLLHLIVLVLATCSLGHAQTEPVDTVYLFGDWRLSGGHFLEVGYAREFAKAPEPLPGGYGGALTHYTPGTYYSAGFDARKGKHSGLALEFNIGSFYPDADRRAEAMREALPDAYAHFDEAFGVTSREDRKTSTDISTMGVDLQWLHFMKAGPIIFVPRVGIGFRAFRSPRLEYVVRPVGSNLFDVYYFNGKRAWAPALVGGFALTHHKLKVLRLVVKGGISRHRHQTTLEITNDRGLSSSESFSFQRTYPTLLVGLTLHISE